MILGDECFLVLELIKDSNMTRPRMKPVYGFPESTRVEVSRKIRELFPLGTRFKAKVRLCQKHYPDGSIKGNPYLRVQEEIGVIVSSIKDEGLIAKLDPTGKSGRKYYYVYNENS